jgi:hypothetical protein
MRYVLLFLVLATAVQGAGFDYANLHTHGKKPDGTLGWIKCPVWDWELVPPECRVPAFNCVPICGKWPGDNVDIGAYEYVPGITSERPWGVWEGVPFNYVPGERVQKPENLRRR